MGLFDSLKNIITNKANNAIGEVINKAKEGASGINNATHEAAETVKEEVKEKTENAIKNSVKAYFNNAQKVTTEDGKEAINALQNLIDDADNTKKAATGEITNDTDYLAKSQEDLNKLSEIANRIDNNQNQ